jgi:hypothetical protein
MLHLLTQRQDVLNPQGRLYSYTEGLIQTFGKFEYTYGYCEARLKVPAEDGPGLWPAFWMLSTGWPPEDDVAEFWTGRPVPHTHQGFAFRDMDGRVQWQSIHKDHIEPGFHTFGMEWGPGYQIFNRDDQITLTVYGPHVPSVPMYMILNSGVASNPGPTTRTHFPNDFVVDYLRVYSRPPAIAAHNLDFESGSMRPWLAPADRAAIVREHVHSGRFALRLSGPNSRVEQTIYGLQPNTQYRVSAWVKVSDDAQAKFGIDPTGESTVLPRGVDQQAMLTFATGPDSSSATAYFAIPGDSGTAYIDDVRIEPLSK